MTAVLVAPEVRLGGRLVVPVDRRLPAPVEVRLLDLWRARRVRSLALSVPTRSAR